MTATPEWHPESPGAPPPVEYWQAKADLGLCDPPPPECVIGTCHTPSAPPSDYCLRHDRLHIIGTRGQT